MTSWKIFAVDTQFKQLRKRSLKKKKKKKKKKNCLNCVSTAKIFHDVIYIIYCYFYYDTNVQRYWILWEIALYKNILSLLFYYFVNSKLGTQNGSSKGSIEESIIHKWQVTPCARPMLPNLFKQIFKTLHKVLVRFCYYPVLVLLQWCGLFFQYFFEPGRPGR